MTHLATFSRTLGDSELAYFLPSRADGVNDMYLHLGFHAPPSLFTEYRVALAWAILRGRHPLLASRVVMEHKVYDSARFEYMPPTSPHDALLDAQSTLFIKSTPTDALIDAYLNGPRTLSSTRLSALILSSTYLFPTPPSTPGAASFSHPHLHPVAPDSCQFDLLICAAHFLGDGMALHTFANDLFTLLAGSSTLSNADADLELRLEREWSARDMTSPLPLALEARLPPVALAPSHPLAVVQRHAHDLAFRRAQTRAIGAHTFPRSVDKRRHTVVRSVAFEPAVTKRVLARCKAEGVSIAHALFALCNISWARMLSRGMETELPMMMYSALNLRPYLVSCNTSYWFLAVGYFNVVLPAFLPQQADGDQNQDRAATHATFWHRARSAKRQCVAAAKTPLLVPYTQRTARERGARARKFAAMDDETSEQPVTSKSSPQIPSPPLTPVSETGEPTENVLLDVQITEKLPPAPEAEQTPPEAVTATPPSNALVGLSLLGNLDVTYQHGAFPSITLHTLTTGSRQRAGALLVFGYTFAGRLWVSAGWDEAGLGGEGSVVARWWEGVVCGVDEFCAVP